MSETEIIVGTLRPVEAKATLEETAEFICKLRGYEKADYYNNYIELLNDIGIRDYVITKDIIYKVESRDCEYDDIFEAKPNTEGGIDFIVKYYNGGCSFQEAVETALSKLND